MSCWRVLQLSEQPDGEQIPQLLVKPVFRSDSYTVHLTCLSNIWSEELDLEGIVDRASQEQSPIEVSKHDTAQLAILIDTVRKSLEDSDADDAVCRITRNDNDGITLHTTISLPKPLDHLTWKFYLSRRSSTTLKNELILPLLISSHIRHERIASLVSTIEDKDKAITRLVDQYESSNLDLAAAFPIISGLKSSGKKAVKREQAARHIPALQPFREDAFKQKTGQLVDSDVTTLGLFQQALSECASEVPSQLKSKDEDVRWWSDIPDRLLHPKPIATGKAKKPAPAARPTSFFAESNDDETEDEFETHATFKPRNIQSRTARAPPKSSPGELNDPHVSDDDDVTEDDDLDAPPKTQSQGSRKTVPKRSPLANSPSPEEPPPPALKSKVKGFRIGGRCKKSSSESPSLPDEAPDAAHEVDDLPIKAQPSSPIIPKLDTMPKNAKRTFKIGGKRKGGNVSSSQATAPAIPSIADRTRTAQSPRVRSPSPLLVGKSLEEETQMLEEKHEETPEEKAERRRAELKRKTEEAAKKQAQSKKKRRF